MEYLHEMFIDEGLMGYSILVCFHPKLMLFFLECIVRDSVMTTCNVNSMLLFTVMRTVTKENNVDKYQRKVTF